MNKFFLGLVCGIILAVSTTVVASSIQAVLFPTVLHFHVNGELKQVDGTGDNIVLSYNNKAYIPLRLFAENSGATVDYRSKSDSDGEKSQIDVYLAEDQLFTNHDPQGYISIGNIQTHFSSDQSFVSGLLKINKSFDSRKISLDIKTNDNEYRTDYFAISNPENQELQAGDVRAFTAYLSSSKALSDADQTIQSISVQSEEYDWEESQIEHRPGGTFVQTPFNVSFGVRSSPVEKRDGTNLIYSIGDPINYRFAVGTTEDQPLFLRKPLAFSLEIVDVNRQKVIWSGSTKALQPMEFPSWQKYETLIFSWNQRDSNGNPVPPGNYMARVVGDAAIQYSEEPTSPIQTQEIDIAILNRGGQVIVIEPN